MGGGEGEEKEKDLSVRGEGKEGGGWSELKYSIFIAPINFQYKSCPVPDGSNWGGFRREFPPFLPTRDTRILHFHGNRKLLSPIDW